jgi:hypothetical protein
MLERRAPQGYAYVEERILGNRFRWQAAAAARVTEVPPEDREYDLGADAFLCLAPDGANRHEVDTALRVLRGQRSVDGKRVGLAFVQEGRGAWARRDPAGCDVFEDGPCHVVGLLDLEHRTKASWRDAIDGLLTHVADSFRRSAIPVFLHCRGIPYGGGVVTPTGAHALPRRRDPSTPG